MFFCCICLWKTFFIILHHLLIQCRSQLCTIISSNVSLRGEPTKIHSLRRHNKRTILHMVQRVLRRLNWVPKDKDKLSYRFYLHKISLSIDNLSRIFCSCNLLILGYSPGIVQSRISYSQHLNTLRQLVLWGFAPRPH